MQERPVVIWRGGFHSQFVLNSVSKVTVPMLRALALQLLVLFSLSTFCVHSACGDDRPNFVIFVADGHGLG